MRVENLRHVTGNTIEGATIDVGSMKGEGNGRLGGAEAEAPVLSSRCGCNKRAVLISPTHHTASHVQPVSPSRKVVYGRLSGPTHTRSAFDSLRRGDIEEVVYTSLATGAISEGASLRAVVAAVTHDHACGKRKQGSEDTPGQLETQFRIKEPGKYLDARLRMLTGRNFTALDPDAEPTAHLNECKPPSACSTQHATPVRTREPIKISKGNKARMKHEAHAGGKRSEERGAFAAERGKVLKFPLPPGVEERMHHLLLAPNAHAARISPPSKNRLRHRYRKRGEDDAELGDEDEDVGARRS
ncbi:hypothetical protein B0H17DRAFT_1144989 [Mycena rosella]|uniref:Uncharacterized protein n=1 Tax=Mycena rosella TaxID=1033263 RepID=A0AAD7CS97_MYCRO|nr:hypothetical protein B0H17DRAFT_1144989 [Mycena rosella]